MKSRRTLLRLLLLVPFLAPLLSLAAGFPQEGSDLAVDPAVRWGRLENGIRYAIMPNTEPKGRASLRFVVAAGSLNENDDQRGLAHFLEHMAFNGSTHFPAGTLVEYFQRLGMSFGGDTNAFTSFDRTVYMLELPDTHAETLGKAFTLFGDYAGGLLLDAGEIDKERGIILSEKRARDSVQFRQFIGEFEFLLPDSRLIKRIPIGLEDIISHSQRDRFVEFYNLWYRPELISVVAVGDFDPALVETELKKALSPITARAPAQPTPEPGPAKNVDGVVTKFLPEAEAPAVHVSIQTITPYAFEPDTAANRLKYLPRTLALSMVNRRLSILVKKEGAPFLGGSISANEQFDFFRNASVEMTCKPEQWQAALAVGEQELRRALQYGFQPAELKEAVAKMRNNLEQAVRTAPTRRSEGLAGELADCFIDRQVFTHPTAEAALYTPALDHVTVDDCLAALRGVWDDKIGRRIFVTGNLKLDDADKQIAAAYATSHAVAVAAPEKVEQSAFAYTNFGAAGTVAKKQVIEDLGITLVEFKNGVRLNLKPTDFEAGRIRINVRVGGGRLTEPAALPGIAFVASNSFMLGGLGKHSSDDLQRLLAGKTVGSSFAVAQDAFHFGGTTNRADLALQLQLLCAYLTDPGFRPEGMRQLQKNIGPYYTQLANTVQGPLQLEAPRLLANGDPRFGVPPQAAVAARTTDEVKAWLTPEFTHGAVEVAIVGDFDVEAAIAAVASTYGALPPRSPKPGYEEQRKASYPAAPIAKEYFVPTEIPKGIVALFWPATDNRDVKLARRLTLLASVFSDRLRKKIREEMGDTYSPSAGANLSDTFRGYGLISADATVAPEQARKVADAMRAVADDLQKNGVTEDELLRAKQPAITAIKQSMRTNPYWLGNVLAAGQEFPERIEWSRTRLSDMESITPAELTPLAAQYLVAAKVSEFISLPEAKPAAPAAPATPTTPASPATPAAPAGK
ncbi:MAG TPA: insulinase family protein [Candidatus Didemnitutus sp.]|nr:insulinase family protein [Candidatus Didemnitutus sp.]